MLRHRLLVAGLSGAAVLTTTATFTFAFADNTGAGPLPTASGQDSLTHDCVQAAIRQGEQLSHPDSWRHGVTLGLGTGQAFLVIRDDHNAALCAVADGKAHGLSGGFDANSRHNYGNLTAARPFDYLDAMDYPDRTVMFGIVTDDVTALSLVGPDGSATPATLLDGTFVAPTKSGESSEVSATNHVRATLKDGTVVTGPLRN